MLLITFFRSLPPTAVPWLNFVREKSDRDHMSLYEDPIRFWEVLTYYWDFKMITFQCQALIKIIIRVLSLIPSSRQKQQYTNVACPNKKDLSHHRIALEIAADWKNIATFENDWWKLDSIDLLDRPTSEFDLADVGKWNLINHTVKQFFF